MTVGMGAGQLASAATYLVAARSSTPAQLGPVLSITAVAMTIGNVLDWGTTSNGLRNLTDRRLSSKAYGSWMYGRASWFAIAGLLFLLLALSVGAPIVVALGGGLLVVTVALPTSATAPWRVAGKFYAVSANALLSRLTSLVVMGLIAALTLQVVIFLPLVLSVGLALEAMLPVFSWPREMRRPGTVDWWPWRGSGRLGLANVALSFQALDTPLIARVASPAVAGEYGAVARWTAPLGLIATSFCQSAFPRMAAARSARDALSVLQRGLKWLLLAGSLALIVFFFSQSIVDFLLGPAYLESGAALAILAVATIFGGVNQGLYLLLIARRSDTGALLSMILLALTQLTAAAALSPVLGARGGALAVLAAQFVASLVMSCILWRLLARERATRKEFG